MQPPMGGGGIQGWEEAAPPCYPAWRALVCMLALLPVRSPGSLCPWQNSVTHTGSYSKQIIVA